MQYLSSLPYFSLNDLQFPLSLQATDSILLWLYSAPVCPCAMVFAIISCCVLRLSVCLSELCPSR